MVERENGTALWVAFLVSLYCEYSGVERIECKLSKFGIYLNTEGSGFQIQLDLFSLSILSPAVITLLLNSKGEKGNS
jgi:hypothetical protein